MQFERQLSLFKGKRQRGVKPPSPLEFASQCFLADTLRVCCNPAWQWTHVPMGERRHIATAKRLKRMGVRPGWPDFQFAGPNAKMAFVELKRKGKKASEAQETIAEHLVACGFDYLITDNVREAVAFLKRLGILPATVGV
jgi:hypothetical protein